MQMGLLNVKKHGNPKPIWDYYGTTKIGKINDFMKKNEK
jgi:hypothetical protein